MRYLFMVVACCGLLLGCQSTPKDLKNQTQLTANLPEIDLNKAPNKLDQYHMGYFSVGAWVNQKLGNYFSPVEAQHPQAAIVYLYRPDTRWNKQEIAAANIFINGKRIPSLLNNHYYWVELPQGSYRISTSRPLLVFHFQEPKFIDLQVQAGQVYYLKYDEENPNRKQKTGPFMMMQNEIAENEIAYTRLKSSSYNFVAQDTSGHIRKKVQELKPKPYDQASEVVLVKPFKIWNPLTW